MLSLKCVLFCVWVMWSVSGFDREACPSVCVSVCLSVGRLIYATGH